jgi:hypothetical protein
MLYFMVGSELVGSDNFGMIAAWGMTYHYVHLETEQAYAVIVWTNSLKDDSSHMRFSKADPSGGANPHAICMYTTRCGSRGGLMPYTYNMGARPLHERGARSR